MGLSDKHPPNHFIGTCFDDAWVKKMETQLGVSASERDSKGRLAHPYLRPALKNTRFLINDPRTAADPATLFRDECMPAGAVYFGYESKIAGGKLVDRGKIAGTLIVEIKTWVSNAIATMVFAILAQEMVGYEVSLYRIPYSPDMAQRMSSVGLGRCTPVHANVETWTQSMTEIYAVYANETYCAGGVGYFGRSGVYTLVDFVKDGANPAKHNPIYSADFFRDYAFNDELIGALAVSKLRNNSKHFPPKTIGCPDGELGCKNHCSRSYACTLREAQGKECLVVVLQNYRYDLGFVQAVFSNNDIPAYFCFLDYGGAYDYIIEAAKNSTPLVFYYYEPDTIFFEQPNKFERIFLPRSTPEEAAKNTLAFGENGYGNKTNNPIRVDFPMIRLDKWAPMLLRDNQPAGGFLNAFTLTELSMNQLMATFVDTTRKTPPSEDAYFTTACTWLKDHYDDWKLWIERLPTCSFEKHITYTIEGCSADGEALDNSTHIRTISFQWRFPDPANASLSYECDGGYAKLPDPMKTSRSCSWLAANPSVWAGWIDASPKCEADFMDFKVSTCASDGTRRAIFHWKIPRPDDPTLSGECEGGVKLNPDVVLPCDYVPHNASAFVIVIVISAIVLVLLVAALAFVFISREKPIIKRSQFEFLMIMVLGGIILVAAVLLYAGAPTRFLCAARPTFIALGFTMIFGSLVVKSLRVYRVFSSQAMKRVVLSTKVMFKMFMVFVAVDCIVLIAWFAVDFPEPTVSYTQMLELNGGSYGSLSCKSSSFIFSALLIFWKAIVLAMGLYLSFLIRNLSNDFQESIWIFASSVVVLFGSLVMLPMAYLVTLDAIPFYMFLAFSLLFCTVLVMSMMLVPKAFRLNEEAKSSKYSAPSAQHHSEQHTKRDSVTTAPSRPKATVAPVATPGTGT
ncbi:hypothetical protein ATCC90586_000051 [Pythium insidiosum]|nr:hypothetical protein ATCC90586_000051 [Pythium insidiosum]